MSLDSYYMGVAIELAEDAVKNHQRPFGALVVDRGICTTIDYNRIIGFGWGSGHDLDPTSHSELHAIRMACKARHGLLEGCTIYSTHEPCIMCCGGIMHSHASRVVWGSWRSDLPDLFHRRKISSGMLLSDTSNRRVEWLGSILNKECVALFDHERVAR